MTLWMRTISSISLSFAILITAAMPATAAKSRIKDIVSFEGIRENQLVGYGLVVGLGGSGDTLRNAPFTEQSLASMLERLGVNIKNTDMKTKNVAAVMVTANLTAFARQGTRIDITVSSLGDAQDLKGGTLLPTPLMGADGEVYAVGQGVLAVGGFTVTGDAATVTQGVPTNGRIANGALVERELPFELASLNEIKISLRNPDLTTAKRITDEINGAMKSGMARTLDPATVQLIRPVGHRLAMVDILTQIETLSVVPDQKAMVVIDERTGTVVIGNDVRINAVAIAQGNLIVKVTEEPEVSQPQPFGQGQTTVTPNSTINIDDGSDQRLTLIPNTITLRDLVNALNALELGPRDIIIILQAIKSAGAMQAEIRTM